MRKSDASLIRAVVAGNADAFGPLVTRYQESVYALVWSVLGDFASTEDAAQEAFVTAYMRLSQLRDPAAFPAWLRRIAANTARMRRRRQSNRETAANMNQLAATNGGASTGLCEHVAEILASLPPKKREVAILCYLDGASRKDAACFLGISEAALRKRLHDAKRLLQRRIVEAAERNLEEHLLPRDFASRCVCGCKRALDANRKDAMPMDAKKDNCRCGCRTSSKTKGRRKNTQKSKRSKAAGGRK
ncbi:MAG: RNA polymerase sigma factor [Planctomycetota bacterium]|jgi:RNA polymerase sigma-70 factor (ECF subfamily)